MTAQVSPSPFIYLYSTAFFHIWERVLYPSNMEHISHKMCPTGILTSWNEAYWEFYIKTFKFIIVLYLQALAIWNHSFFINTLARQIILKSFKNGHKFCSFLDIAKDFTWGGGEDKYDLGRVSKWIGIFI